LPYLYETIEGDRAREEASVPLPLGPGFSEDVLNRIARLEIHCTSATDPSEWCEFHAFDDDGIQISRKRISGY